MALEPQAVTINVVGPSGEAVPAYRWVVEHDRTYHVQPGVAASDTVSVRFHRSYMPVVATGDQSTPLALDPEQRYYISVLPGAGFGMGGAQIAAGQSSVTIVVNAQPTPTAQITIAAFEDRRPINGQFDQPAEGGLAGFAVQLEDAGGRYGISAMPMMTDAFGNPLGTTYDADGNVMMMGSGVIHTGPDGRAMIKNISPGKYGVRLVPPTGSTWVQTTTIEGTKTIDAWVKADEPPWFQEFGPPGNHVEIGFVRPMNDTSVLVGGGTTISGQIVNLHMSRPPGALYSGAPFAHTRPWVGLNVGPLGAGRGVYAQRANADGTFSIPNVPVGSHQLVVWDDALDLIFAFHGVTVTATGACGTPSGSCNLGDVPVFQWFTRQEHHVFHDANGNGLRDAGEMGIPDMAVNLRWRDGTLYQSMATDHEGFVPFDQIFPFFAWQVAEVDFTRLKATGVTVTVDNGGPIDASDPWSFGGQLNPQPQTDNGGLPYRTETGPVLTQAFQGFIGQTSVFQWGKKAYGPGENGGISGIVYYATTRAENDPRMAAAEPWEPGIPGVTVRLYDSTGTTLLNEVTTDSWDDNVPTGCQGPGFVFRGQPTDCFDGLANFNQVRPGVFDGGYAFTSYYPSGFGTGTEVQGLPAGEYVIEVVPPPGYKIVKEEDRNVDFGESYKPSMQALPAVCVGALHEVPTTFSLFALQDDTGANVPPHRAGEMTPLCDRKRVPLQNGQNAAADFFLFTDVPIAGHIIGFVLNDAANENDPTAPTFGEKQAPPWLPISVRDWTGREIGRTYSDEFGVYNVLVPSTFTANRPMPSGMAPNMLTVCLNSPTKPDPASAGGYVLDPHYNPQYSQFCYTFQYMPGTTTYLDTPVLPTAAFAGPGQYPLDCEYPTGTPRVWSVSGASGVPHVAAADGTATLTIHAPNAGAGGVVPVSNPAYDGTNAKTIDRDYGFGASAGQVLLGSTPLPIVSWSAGVIVATVPVGATSGQLKITRGDNGRSTVNAVTVHVGNAVPVVPVAPGQKIQPVIDSAPAGALVLVPPGSYDELLVMWKPLRLQGSGEGTIINALKAPAEKLAAWRAKVTGLITSGSVSLVPGQETGAGLPEPITLFTEEGPGILVLAKNANRSQGGFAVVQGVPNARIDGFTITGGDSAGGILVNGFAHGLQITNNRVIGNHSFYGGGVRLGHPLLTHETGGVLEYPDAQNDRITIANNQISRNGALEGAGGGVALYPGSTDYRVSANFICGNYTQGEGAGVGQLGFSPGGVISGNQIIFNESFNQGRTVSGGGVAIVGQPPLAPATISPGTGSVQIIGNEILGNSAGAGDGAGVRLSRINGLDIQRHRRNSRRWHTVELVNNIIANNVAALAGGGISLQDAVLVNIAHNTVANNDSTATAGEAFSGGLATQSVPQPAGIVSRAHSPELVLALPEDQPGYSAPKLTNSIVWHNRSFFFAADTTVDPPQYLLFPTEAQAPVYRDLEVIGITAMLDPRYCILTSTTGYHASNVAADPLFVAEYFNRSRGQTVAIPEATTALQAQPAFDEGGNWIRVGYGPLTLSASDTLARLGDYRLQAGSPAIDAGQALTTPAAVTTDIEGQPRPAVTGGLFDIGADERQ